MKRKHDRVGKARKANELVNNAAVPIEEAIAAVSTIGGTIFDIKLKELDGRAVWRVKLIRAAERVKVHVDANSGDIIGATAEVTTMDAEQVQRLSAMGL